MVQESTPDEREMTARLAGTAADLVERLAERLGARANVAAVFGEPVVQDGVTVVPVAKVRWGFGGGGGCSGDAPGIEERLNSGSGGGGGVTASAVGFIEIRGGQAQFRPIKDPAALWPVILAGGFASLFVLSGLRRLVRR